tara:strand:- start:358 stop:957 length:600 start_codon:yes stop_codon:yes gene_type:complete
MVLPQCNFFPHTPLTLFIFEPRYRQMLAKVLETDRVFCIGTPAGGQSDAPIESVAGIYQHGTVGLVRACVKNDDGTSHLVLDGLERVHFIDWIVDEPYRIAEIVPVETAMEDASLLDPFLDRIGELLAEMRDGDISMPPLFAQEEWRHVEPEILVDWIANYFIEDIHARHFLLSEPRLVERYRFVTNWMETQVAAIRKS